MGHQPTYAADPLGSLQRWTAEYGDAVPLRFGPTRVLLLTSPEAVQDVLVDEADNFRKAPLIRKAAGRVIGESLFNAEGEAWRKQRELLEGFFSPARMDEHVPLIGREVAAMADRWASTARIPVVVDESCVVAADIPKVAGAADGINIKLAKCGSLREALRMIATARAHGMLVMVGCMIESSLGITAAAHFTPLVDAADLEALEQSTNPIAGSSWPTCEPNRPGPIWNCGHGGSGNWRGASTERA